ncbi:type III pantothenate kinase [Halochromatium glycolicum]|uniref:Type III pantothenate kinase n=1 Tax=Halochromatium glycolicum TaxID=85075 RepID=A0AAJ0U6Y2_9GAMM|nr:type III pantothenate kinase [Halochromatium glycolicum]MBK1705925.1 hypothetical protein [Halochromatium glycolicum]
MKLLIDIGNTSLKWALYQDGEIGPMRSARHFEALPIDVIASWEQIARVSKVLVASVGPQGVFEAVIAAARACWNCPVVRIETGVQAHGVRIAYAEPSRLGVDRFLALVAAHSLPTPAAAANGSGHRADTAAAILIVDVGTAITFDGLLADGTHLGGQILPGIATLRSSLLQRTQLPSHQTQDHPGIWGQDTGPAIAGASLQAPVAVAERLVHRLEQQTGVPPRLILTGGDAERIATLFDTPLEQHPDLVLRGLARFD